METLTAKYGKDRVIFSQCDVTDYPQFEGTIICDIYEFIMSISNWRLYTHVSFSFPRRLLMMQYDATRFAESFQTTIAEFGHIDIVINNAGIMNDRFWELEVDINLVSKYYP